LEKQGISVELIDLRSLVPYDWERVAESIKKTNRVVVAHEDPLSYGYGAEIAARIADELFEYPRRARPKSRRDRYVRRLRAAGRRFYFAAD
jgi:pyruvate/2-oxoglutarate/acetoin dehydrogenase E1 component